MCAMPVNRSCRRSMYSWRWRCAFIPGTGAAPNCCQWAHKRSTSRWAPVPHTAWVSSARPTIFCSFASSARVYAALNPGTVNTDLPSCGVDATTLLTTCEGPTLTRPLIYPCITHMQGLRHPSVEAARGSSMFIPNDVDLRDDRRLAIVTGNTYSNVNKCV